jgi:4-hydroxy-3-methylbut-2-enyl diphosphate reductase
VAWDFSTEPEFEQKLEWMRSVVRERIWPLETLIEDLFGRYGNHAEIVYDDVQVPADAILGAPGAGFLIAQQRLYPGRIHHCMRWLGVARRAFDMTCPAGARRRGGSSPSCSSRSPPTTEAAASRTPRSLLHCRAMPAGPEKLLLAAPRGYCAGVDRAVQTVERALELHGAPLYVRKEIVHNKHVVEQLRARGAMFVESEEEVPEGATVVFSAHGVAPSVHANAQARDLQTIDATCPLVTKVHVEAKKFAAAGYTIVLVGHAGHEEVEGTMGEAPDHIVLIESEDDVDALEVEDPSKVAYISQTTLSVDETRAIIDRLRARFPAIVGPRTDDICYATTNRQAAVKQLARRCELVLVIGSDNSSNSNRLVEVARECGAEAHLIDNELHVSEEWLSGKRVVGITSGASAPEELVQRLVEFFRARGTGDVQELEVVQEDVRFMLPKVIRQATATTSA